MPKILALQEELNRARQTVAMVTSLQAYDRAKRKVAFLKDVLAGYGVKNP